MANIIRFFTQFVRSPRTIGALIPSSKALATAMIAPIDFQATPNIIELGPGTGPFTDLLYQRLDDKACYTGIEINALFYNVLKNKYQDFRFYNQSAENLGDILDDRGIAAADVIVCGIPWASLPLDVQDRIMAEVIACLKPGGLFLSFAYVQGLLLPGARRFRQVLRDKFSYVTRSPIVWGNIPPAFVYVCTK